MAESEVLPDHVLEVLQMSTCLEGPLIGEEPREGLSTAVSQFRWGVRPR